MTWILVLLMTNGSMKKVKFNSEKACVTVKNEVILGTLPKLQKAFCVKDAKK